MLYPLSYERSSRDSVGDGEGAASAGCDLSTVRPVRRLLGRLLGPVTRPIVRLLCVLVVAGVAVAVLDLLKGVFVGTHSLAEKAVLVVISIGLVVLAAPIINAARPVKRPDRP
jgi:hypothetical protein